MITIRQRPPTVSLSPALSRLVQNAASGADQTKNNNQIVTTGTDLPIGMRRVFELYKSGAYFSAGYSQRSQQRHRKYFLSMGIDLRKPYSPSATARVSMPEQPAKQRTQSMPNKKKIAKPPPAPEPTSAASDPACRKSQCASDALSRSAHRARVPPRRTGITTGLGALARRAR